MNKSEIISSIALDKEYRDAAFRISDGNELAEDLFQELMVVLCKYDERKIVELHTRGELKWFVVRVMMTMWRSTSSPFYITYRRPLLPVQPITEEYDLEKDNVMQQAIDGVNELLAKKKESHKIGEWAEWKTFDLYQQHGSCRKVARLTHIPYSTVRDTVRRMKLIITEQIKFSPPQ